MKNPQRKSGTYNPIPPSVSKMNKDQRNNDIMKVFNDIKDKTRMEITDQFNMNTFPSPVPNMKSRGSKKR